MKNLRFVDLLKDAMEHAGMSQSVLARRARVDRMFLWSLLRGDPPPRVRRNRTLADKDLRYHRMAQVLGVSDPERFIAQAVAEQRAPRDAARVPVDRGERNASSQRPLELLHALMEGFKTRAAGDAEVLGLVPIARHWSKHLLTLREAEGRWSVVVDASREVAVVTTGREANLAGFGGNTGASHPAAGAHEHSASSSRMSTMWRLLADTADELQTNAPSADLEELVEIFYALSLDNALLHKISDSGS